MSAQTRSFVSLIILAAVLSGLLLYFTKYRNSTKLVVNTEVKKTATQEDKKTTEQIAGEKVQVAPTDVNNWQVYTDSNLKLSFKYPTSWQVSTVQATDPDYNIIVIDPGQNQDHFRIYATNNNFFAAEGLKKQATKIAGQEAWTVQDILFGVKTKTKYFTFDLGSNLNLKPTLKALVSTVAFSQ